MMNARYLQLLQALLPPGLAWTRDEDAELTKLLRGLSVEPGRVEARSEALIEEIDPRTTTELLPDWERVFALPGKCGAPSTVEGRRQALHAKMLGPGETPASLPNLAAVASALGYEVTIREYGLDDMLTCVSPCTSALYSRKWMYVWDVTTTSGANDTQLECQLRDLAPQHTLVRFFYE